MIIEFNRVQKNNEPEQMGWIATAIGAAISLATAITSAALRKRSQRLALEKQKVLAKAQAVSDAKKIAEVKAINAKTESLINSKQVGTSVATSNVNSILTTDNMIKYGLPITVATVLLLRNRKQKSKNSRKR